MWKWIIGGVVLGVIGIACAGTYVAVKNQREQYKQDHPDTNNQPSKSDNNENLTNKDTNIQNFSTFIKVNYDNNNH